MQLFPPANVFAKLLQLLAVLRAELVSALEARDTRIHASVATSTYGNAWHEKVHIWFSQIQTPLQYRYCESGIPYRRDVFILSIYVFLLLTQ
jgi:hypothetical protein